MTKEEIINKVHAQMPDKPTLINWLRSLPRDAEKRKPNVEKIGDVFSHSVFQHPYILLHKTKDFWICGLMTSNGEYPDILCECKSRFFQDKHITRTIFTVTEVQGSFINVYDNTKHLKEVYRTLLKTFL